MIVEICTQFGKNCLENPARREHRRPGIDRDAAAIDGAQFAPRRRHPLDYGHRQAAPGQQHRRDQAADAGADDDDASVGGYAGHERFAWCFTVAMIDRRGATVQRRWHDGSD